VKHTIALCTLNAELFNVKIIAMVVMDIVIIIIIYHLYAGYLQTYTCKNHVKTCTVVTIYDKFFAISRV